MPMSLADILFEPASSSHLSTTLSGNTSDIAEQAERHGIIRERNREWELYQIHQHGVRIAMGMPWIDETRIYRYEGGLDFTLKVNIRENLPNNNIYLNLRTNKFEYLSQDDFDDWRADSGDPAEVRDRESVGHLEEEDAGQVVERDGRDQSLDEHASRTAFANEGHDGRRGGRDGNRGEEDSLGVAPSAHVSDR